MMLNRTCVHVSVFDELGPLRKEIQGDLMGKVDCVMEACQESYNDGVRFNKIENALRMLKMDKLSLDEISEITGLPLDELMELKDKS